VSAILQTNIHDEGMVHMGVMNGIIDGTVTSSLIVYCVGMALIFGGLAWVTHLDQRAD
jgi:hypothetical protein